MSIQINNFIALLPQHAEKCIDKYVIQIALDTASIMTNNWPKGKNWKGTSWKGLAKWNAGKMGGGKSYLTDETYMRESDHKEFLRKAIWSGDFDYSMYPDANVGGGSYAELHQTGGTNAKGVKLPARPWHPDDLGELSDFPANVIKEAYEGAITYYKVNVVNPAYELIAKLQNPTD